MALCVVVAIRTKSLLPQDTHLSNEGLSSFASKGQLLLHGCAQIPHSKQYMVLIKPSTIITTADERIFWMFWTVLNDNIYTLPMIVPQKCKYTVII